MMCGMDGCRPEETVFDHGLRAPHGGHARSFSQRPAHLYHASPRRPQETRHRSISSLERRLEAVTSLTPRAPVVTHRVILAGAMAPYAWSLNGEYWPNVIPLMITRGQRVAIEMLNHTMMPHPMHLHGHAFQVVAINSAPLAGAVRDTILVPPMGRVTIAFDADNPGRWAFHCHNLYHMMTGMMTEVRYLSII
jgi:FtsP/CotA-like multicopper oxidase with cupredoxin domain